MADINIPTSSRNRCATSEIPGGSGSEFSFSTAASSMTDDADGLCRMHARKRASAPSGIAKFLGARTVRTVAGNAHQKRGVCAGGRCDARAQEKCGCPSRGLGGSACKACTLIDHVCHYRTETWPIIAAVHRKFLYISLAHAERECYVQG